LVGFPKYRRSRESRSLPSQEGQALITSLSTQTLNPAITFYAFAALKQALIPAKNREHPSAIQTFLCGAFASSLASLATYPLILAKVSTNYSPASLPLSRGKTDIFFPNPGRLAYNSRVQPGKRFTLHHWTCSVALMGNKDSLVFTLESKVNSSKVSSTKV